METARITVDPSRLCRACGAERLQMFPLSARDPDGDLHLGDMLMECTDLKIHVGDGLPSSICYSCADELKTSYRFKQQCETTDRYFNELGLKSNEIKQEQGDSLTITETIVYKQEEKFSEVTEDEEIRVGNLEDSPPNEDLRFVRFPNEKENRNIISKEAENEFPSGLKEGKEEETIDDGSSESSSSSEDDDSDYFPKEELRKTGRLGRFERNIRGKYSSSSNLRMLKQTHQNGGQIRFKCDICGKSYSAKHSLQRHKEIHENGGGKNFKCDVCEKSYTEKRSLQEHKLKHENGERKRFKCDICEKSFTTSKYLRKHKRRHENGEQKRSKCDICEKSFSRSGYLREHKKMHENGEQNYYKCNVCEKSYVARCSLQKHKEMHENGGRKRFKCDVCETSFSDNRYLRWHKLTHDNNIVYEQI